MASFKIVLRRVISIINYKTFVLVALSVASTYFFQQHNLAADFPLAIISTAIIFPIVFSIGEAYKRREVVLNEYANLKAHARAIYYMGKHWVNADEDYVWDLREHLTGMFIKFSNYFTTPMNKGKNNEAEVYASFNTLSLMIQELREKGLVSGEVSRGNQYLSKMLYSFERMKHIYQYRTPRALRTFSAIFIFLLPICYGPYFAFLANSYPPELAYVVPVLFTVVLVSLDNIQANLENPFNTMKGEDHVIINPEKLMASLEEQEAIDNA